MYLNVISFKNGKAISFTSKFPYSVDKVVEGWNVVTTEDEPKQILNFKGTEVVTIINQIIPKDKNKKHAPEKNTKKKPAVSTSVKTE